MTRMQARYVGRCYICDGLIHVGDWIDYRRGEEGGITRHDDCTRWEPPAGWNLPFYTIAQDSTPFHLGEVVHVPKYLDADGILRDIPPYLYVLHTGKRWVFPPGGYVHGILARTGYVYTATCRVATVAESAPVIVKLEANKRWVEFRNANHKQMQFLRERMRIAGVRPQRVDLSKQGHYLSTRWWPSETWYVEPSALWLIRKPLANDDAPRNIEDDAIATRLADETGIFGKMLETCMRDYEILDRDRPV